MIVDLVPERVSDSSFNQMSNWTDPKKKESRGYMREIVFSRALDKEICVNFLKKSLIDNHYTGRERLIRSHSSARFCFELSGNSN